MRARPFAAAPGGLRLAVRLSPKAAAAGITGLIADPEGAVALEVAVTEPPEAGKANDALLRLLAKVLRLKRRDLTLVLGAADRRKLVHVAGDPADLMRHFEETLAPWLTPD